MSGTVIVDRDALREVLQALIGPPHHIRELLVTMSLHDLGTSNPVRRLIDDHNALPTKRPVHLSHLTRLAGLIGPRPLKLEGGGVIELVPPNPKELFRAINGAFNDMMEDQS